MRSQQVLEPQRMSSVPIVFLRTYSRQASAPITSTPGCSRAAPSCSNLPAALIDQRLRTSMSCHSSSTSDKNCEEK